MPKQTKREPVVISRALYKEIMLPKTNPKNLVRDLKKAVAIVEEKDKHLADLLDNFISTAIISMNLTHKEAAAFEKWFYEED